MSTLVQDLRLALRMLIKQPAASTFAVLALGLGVGLTTMMFSNRERRGAARLTVRRI